MKSIIDLYGGRYRSGKGGHMRLFRFVLILAGTLTSVLGLVGYQAFVRRGEIANVYVWAVSGTEKNILSFTTNNPAPNLVYSGKSLPVLLDPNSVLLASDGHSLV